MSPMHRREFMTAAAGLGAAVVAAPALAALPPVRGVLTVGSEPPWHDARRGDLWFNTNKQQYMRCDDPNHRMPDGQIVELWVRAQ